MNLRVSTRFLRAALIRTALACGLGGGVAAPPAQAQPTPSGGSTGAVVVAPPPPAALPAPKALSDADKISDIPNVAAINQYIKDNIARLIDTREGEPVATGRIEARAELIAATIAPKPTTPPSVVYLTTYLNALAKELALLTSNPSMRVRVNVGIVTARVAENAKAILPPTALQGVILSLLKDPNDAIALWGMKAAGSLLSAPNQPAPNAPVLNQLLPSLQDHKLNGAMTDEAYSALQEPVPPIINALIAIFKVRVGAYGASIPSDPSIDRRPASLLTIQQGMWSKMSPADQSKVMGLIADLLAAASKATATKEIKPETAEQLRTALSKTCEAVIVVASSQDQPALKDDATRASKNLGINVAPAAILEYIDPVVLGIRKAFPINSASAKP